MISNHAQDVIELATVNPSFRSAFRAHPAQAMALFAADKSLTMDEVDAIQSINDEEFAAFTRISAAGGSAKGARSTSSASYIFF